MLKGILKCLLLLPIFCCAQKGDTVIKYLDVNLEFTSKKNAAFYALGIKKEDAWLLYGVYEDNSPLIKAYYKDKNYKIKEGPYLVYYPGKQIAVDGYYKDDARIGRWLFTYPNGIKKDSGSYQNNQQVKEWKGWYEDGQLKHITNYKIEVADPNDKLKIKDNINHNFKNPRHGKSKTWYQNGQLESEGEYENDQLVGEWKWYYSNGKLATKEYYKNSVLSEIECYDSLGNATGDMCPIQNNIMLKKYGDYKQFIYQNLSWPKEALNKNIEGWVEVEFTIDTKGALKNLVITSKEAVLKKEVERIFEYMKEWYPAISHNRTIEKKERMEIPFYHNRSINENPIEDKYKYDQ